MRVVQDVDGAPIKPSDMEIGQLVNAEPGRLLRGRTPTASRSLEGVELPGAKAKAAVIMVRMQPDDITP